MHTDIRRSVVALGLDRADRQRHPSVQEASTTPTTLLWTYIACSSSLQTLVIKETYCTMFAPRIASAIVAFIALAAQVSGVTISLITKSKTCDESNPHFLCTNIRPNVCCAHTASNPRNFASVKVSGLDTAGVPDLVRSSAFALVILEHHTEPSEQGVAYKG